jgi:Tfp pilus assembly protein PilO
MSTVNIGGQEIPAIGIAIGLPVLAALYLADVAYFGMTVETSLMAKYDGIQGQIAEVETKRGEAEELKARTKEIDKVKARIAELEKGITLLKAKIPGEAQVSVLLYDIERIAKSSHGDLSVFQPGEQRKFAGDDSGDIQEIPVTIAASATFPQVITFMEKLNSYERKLSVSNLSLTPTGAKPDLKAGGVYQNTLNLQFTLNAYVLRGKGDTP